MAGYPPPPDLSNDKLFSVKQRHSYFCTDSDMNKDPPMTCGGTKNFKNLKAKIGGRPAVRLRPRHVLCSNCRQVCNEKNERVRDCVKKEASSKIQAAVSGKSQTIPTSKRLSGNSSEECLSSFKTRSGIGLRSNAKNTCTTSKARVANNKSISTLPNNNRKTSSKAVSEVRAPCIRATRSSVKLSDDVTSKRKVDARSGDSVLVPKIKKLKLSELENVSCDTKNNSYCIDDSDNCKFPIVTFKTPEPCSSNVSHIVIKSKRQTSSPQGIKDDLVNTSSSSSLVEDHVGQIPKLRFSSVNNKIARVTLSTSICESQCWNENTNENSHSYERPSIPKMVLSTSTKSENFSSPSKENIHEDGSPFHDSPNSTPSVPKLTILPLASKSSNVPESDSVSDAKERVSSTDSSDDASKHAAPLLKICIGPDGTGTIMNIAPKTETAAEDHPLLDNDSTSNTASSAAKAAKKALKRARKEAQKKLMLSRGSPSCPLFGGLSPRYGGISPRYGGMSPLRLGKLSPARSCWPGDRIGAAVPSKLSLSSPGRLNGASPNRLPCLSPSSKQDDKTSTPRELSSKETTGVEDKSITVKKHKHKMKHKKKRKGEKRDKDAHTDNTLAPSTSNSITLGTVASSSDIPQLVPAPETVANTESTCKPKRKLSLSIKRVKNDCYEYIAQKCSLDESNTVERDSSASSMAHHSSGMSSTSGDLDSSSDDQCDVPAFPETMLSPSLPWQKVNSCVIVTDDSKCASVVEEGEGRRVAVGDVVWAKLHGFPWWPSKVTTNYVPILPLAFCL